MKKDTKSIVAIGVGTGLFALLSGIKNIPNIEISAIVTMTDSGGSTGRLRDEFGYLPIGDVRQCIVALSEDDGPNNLLRQIFLYRFSKGIGLEGHNLGNLFLTALTDILGSEEEAIKHTSSILKIKGRVIPVTVQNTNLVAEYTDGTMIYGEGLIDKGDISSKEKKIEKIFLNPKANLNPDAKKVLLEADMIILGPGDIYTSIIPNLLVNEIQDVIDNSKSKILYIVNLFSKLGQTYKMNTKEHVDIIERYLGKRKLDYIIYNNSPIPNRIRKIYEESEEYVVENDIKDDRRLIEADLISSRHIKPTKGDKLQRSIIRHDSNKLKNLISPLIER